jgi:hypothetical protein
MREIDKIKLFFIDDGLIGIDFDDRAMLDFSYQPDDGWELLLEELDSEFSDMDYIGVDLNIFHTVKIIGVDEV